MRVVTSTDSLKRLRTARAHLWPLKNACINTSWHIKKAALKPRRLSEPIIMLDSVSLLFLSVNFVLCVGNAAVNSSVSSTTADLINQPVQHARTAVMILISQSFSHISASYRHVSMYFLAALSPR